MSGRKRLWCSRCFGEIRRRSGLRWYCGEQCRADTLVRRNQVYRRQYVWVRDRGRCALCGLEAWKLEARIHQIRLAIDGVIQIPNTAKSVGMESLKAWKVCKRRSRHSPNGQRRWARVNGWLGRRGLPYRGSFWEADHIVPTVEGGGNGLENLRTLCVPCHVAETAKLKRRLAEKRRAMRGATK